MDRYIAQILMHEQFHALGIYEHDIGLIKLDKPLEYSEWIQPICLPRGNYFAVNNFHGHKIQIAGWGVVDSRTHETPNKLQKIKVPIVDGEICEEFYRMQLNDGQFCAGHQIKDSCMGDSGGPVIIVS